MTTIRIPIIAYESADRVLAQNDLAYSILFPILTARNKWLSWRNRKLRDNLRQTCVDGQIVPFDNFELVLDTESAHDIQFLDLHRRRLSYEPELSDLIRKCLRPGMTFVDVGANNGYFSLMASQCVGESGIVHSFEASPRNYLRLKKNVELNRLQNVIIYNKIVADCTGLGTIYLSALEDGLDSIVPNNDVIGKSLIETVTLDSMLPNSRIDLMKIDVEGAELDVLKGAHTILSSNPDIVLSVEYNKHIIHEKGENYDSLFIYLHELGFKIGDSKEIYANNTQDRSFGSRSFKDISSHKDLNHTFTNLVCCR